MNIKISACAALTNCDCVCARAISFAHDVSRWQKEHQISCSSSSSRVER